jgi:hypothetical protein
MRLASQHVSLPSRGLIRIWLDPKVADVGRARGPGESWAGLTSARLLRKGSGCLKTTRAPSQTSKASKCGEAGQHLDGRDMAIA